MIVVIGGIGLALIAVEGWLLLMLLRQNGRLMLRVDEMETRLDALGERSDAFDGEDDDEDGFEGFASERPGARAHAAAGLPVGSPAPAFRLPGVHGETQTLEALLAPELPTALLFMDPHCGPCNALMPEVGRWQREYDDRLTVAVISRGSVQANRPKVDEHGLANVMLQKNREVAESFKVHGTPGAVIVRADGTVGTPAALGADAIKALVRRALGQAAPADGRANGHDHVGHAHDGHDHDHEGHDHAGHDHAGQGPVARLGDPAPAIKLPDLGGRTVDVADLRGSKVLVVFWNQGCGFCRRMLPDLQAWDASPPAGAPKLLVVSTGSPDEHKDMNLTAPVLLDQAFSVAPAFGANGTPMAVLLDEQGRVASAVATGAEEVLGLANGRMPSAKSGPAVPDPAIDRSVGEEAPDFELSDLDGKRVSLREYRGTPTLLVFWGPSCGFCQRLLPELKAWEANPPPDAPKLLVLATGTAEANRAQGFRSPVLLDDVFAVGRLYGARGTPSGMLVDAEGKIAAPLGVGAQSVLKLAGGPSAARAESA
jgi:peroxiredoxin